MAAQEALVHFHNRRIVLIMGNASRDRFRTWSTYQNGVHRTGMASAEFFTVPPGRTLVIREIEMTFPGNARKTFNVELLLRQGMGNVTLARMTFRDPGGPSGFTASRTFSPGIVIGPGGQVNLADSWPGAGSGEVRLHGFYLDD